MRSDDGFAMLLESGGWRAYNVYKPLKVKNKFKNAPARVKLPLRNKRCIICDEYLMQEKKVCIYCGADAT